MARWAKSPAAAGKVKEPLLTTVGTPDAGKSASGVAAVKIALHHLLDDGPEVTVLLLEAALILGQERVKIIEQHPVEHGAFWMSRAVDPCHGSRDTS